MKKFKLYLLSAFLFSLIALSIVFLSELFVRYLNLKDVVDETRDHVVETPYMPAKLKPSYRGKIWGAPFATNQYGFRGESNFSRPPQPGEFRILSLGDSIGFGLGIDPSEHYIKVLERNLSEQATPHKFRAINAGGQGYSPSGYYVYLKHEGLKFQPKLVIVEIELCNDITDEALLGWEFNGRGKTLPQRLRGGRYIVAWDGNLLATYAIGPYFFEKTYTYTVLLRRSLNLLYLIRPSEPFHSYPGVTYYSLGFDRFLLTQNRIESGWTKMLAVIEGTHQLLKEKGSDFLLMVIPPRYVFEKPSSSYSRFAHLLLARARRFALTKGIPCIDFTDAIEAGGGTRLYFDFAHMTAEGNRVVGNELSEYLLERLKGNSH